MLLRKAEAKIGGLNWCATKVSSASCSSSIKPLSESRSQRKLASVVCQERAGLEVAARGPVLVGVALAKEMAWDEGVLEAAPMAMDWGYLVR